MTKGKQGMLDSRDFMRFLASQVPLYDEQILADMRPSDGRILHVPTGPALPAWFSSRELVRKLSEGICFVSTIYDQLKEEGPDESLERFRNVWPDTRKKWKRIFPN
jgi:hypothetical protein